ncbi:sensor histidine kinase [Agrobacterium pusense]|uniref:histidine kinase n=1 Tax=Agrobacterium pusense TaxID=648995 RepID=A0AA44IZD1_9HYPH|nr:sensor histidine kinase [Agrobacterium pusense]NRF20393.1 sensor histidine kinase [Agrobacterium pusense]
MSILRTCFTLVLALFLVTATTSADSDAADMRVLTVPPDAQRSLSLDGFIGVALFKDETVTLPDVLKRPFLFSPIARHDINLGFVQTSAWMRFALALPPQAEGSQNLLLSLMPNFTDELEVYVGVQKEGMTADDFNHYEMGDHSPRSQVHFNTSANILPLELDPGETTIIYIRARNQDASLNVSAELLSTSDYEYRSIVQNIVRGMWFGGMCILLVIQFFFFYFDRKKFYLFIALDILAVISTYFGSLGLARLLFFDAGGLGNDYLTSSSSWFGLTFGAISIAAILELSQRYPRINFLFRCAAIVGIIGVVCVFIGVNRYFTLVAGPVILLLTTAAMIIAILDFVRRRNGQNGLNLSAFTALWVGLIITNSQRYGVLPLPSWFAGSYALASIVHFTLLTGSLSVRLRNAEAATREADRRALQMATVSEQKAKNLVRERTLELEKAKLLAETALDAELKAQEQQVRFMEVISHQYRTPLGVIKTNLESVRLTLPNSDVANRERLDRASAGVKRLIEVLEVNLTRSRLQGPSYKPTFSKTKVTSLIDAALSIARDLNPSAKITITVDNDSEDTFVLADRDMLRLALVNLLENAVKFSAPTGKSTVELNAACHDEKIFLRVTDQGIGLKDGNMDELVKIGARGENVGYIEGTGVGLSLVARTVETHNGKFMLSNRAEGGTEATIVLPVFNKFD